MTTPIPSFYTQENRYPSTSPVLASLREATAAWEKVKVPHLVWRRALLVTPTPGLGPQDVRDRESTENVKLVKEMNINNNSNTILLAYF